MNLKFIQYSIGILNNEPFINVYQPRPDQLGAVSGGHVNERDTAIQDPLIIKVLTCFWYGRVNSASKEKLTQSSLDSTKNNKVKEGTTP